MNEDLMTIPGLPLPTRLLVPGIADQIRQPVEAPRTQQLPLGELSFENLQRLSVRLLTAMKSAIQCQEYGTPGQKQDGIDLYARLPGQSKIEVWQCKRYKTLTASIIKKSAAEFLRGKLVKQTTRFVLLTSAETEPTALADADLAAAQSMRSHQIEFTLMGRTQLTTLLKDHPRIIDDFFGRYWVNVCCGKEEAERLGQRLSAEEVTRYREKLRALYSSVFEQADSFLARSLTSTGVRANVLPLPQRWVMPTIACLTNAVATPPQEPPQSDADREPSTGFSELQQRTKAQAPTSAVTEMSADAYLASTDRGVILGDPGHGKSALLRVLALDLLSESPKIRAVADRFGTRLPVWLPFAFVSTRVAAGDSIADAGEAWIKKNGGSEALATLFRQAIDDDRLLLLVDGLDEWSDPDRARETILALQGFLSQHKAACFATARPLGYERLDRLSGEWKHGTLQPLSFEEQHVLAKVIFAGVRSTVSEEVRQIEVEKFARQLRVTPALSEMAATPLLMVGMVSLWIRNQSLPDSRLEVCEALVKEMLEDHPSKRAAISASLPVLATILPQVRRAALASLAWSIHSSIEGAYVERIEAERCFCQFFEQSEGMTVSDARSHARQMLPISDQIIGVLAEASPGGDVQFVHRTFQELLAAEHLASRTLVEQVIHCSEKAANPAWHQVLLFLIQKSNRPTETDALIEALPSKRPKHRDELQAKLLLAEAVFAPIRMSPKRRAELAETILDEIENGTWQPYRAALLQKVLPAQPGSIVYTSLIARLRDWTPEPGSVYVYDALAEWPEGTGAEDALWSLLNHEDVYQQVRAARAIGRRCKGQPVWAKRLLSRLHQPLSCEGLGTTLLALAEGWPDYDEAIAAFRKGVNEPASEVVLASVYGLVRSGSQDDRCKEQLLKHGDSIMFEEVVIEAALNGWPRDQDIKDAALRRVGNRYSNQDRAFHNDAAWKIAIEGFPGDIAVAEAIARELGQEYPRFGHRLDQDKMLRAFAGHPEIVPACEAYFSKCKRTDAYSDSPIAALAKTEACKKMLIDWTLKHGVMGVHSLRCLIAVWGVEDGAVKEALDQIRDDPKFIETYTLVVAPMETDKKAVRRKLLHGLKVITQSELSITQAHIIRALAATQMERPDTAVIDAIEPLLKANRETLLDHFVCNALIEGFGDHPKVRALGEQWMQDLECSWGTLATTYRDDAQIRSRVIGLCRCLPDALRLQIANHCRQQASADPDFRAITECFRREEDPDVRTVGAIAMAEASISNGEDSSVLADYFASELMAYGSHFDGRRQAGIAGLIALGQIEMFRDKQGREGEPSKFHFPYSQNQHNILPRFIVRNWQRVKAGLGEDFFERFQSDHDLEILRNVALELGYSSVADEVATFLRSRSKNTAPSLESLARDQAPGWIEACLESMGLVGNRGQSGISVADSNEASRLLATYGAGDDILRARLQQFVIDKHPWSGGALETLARGWPRSEVLMDAWKSHLAAGNNQRLMHAMYPATCGSPEDFVSWFRPWLDKISKKTGSWEGVERWFVMRRCFEDKEVAGRLLDILGESNSTDEWVSFPWLIRSSPLEDADHKLREWADEKWRQTVELDWCFFGFDLFKNDHVPLKESLLDLLFTDRRYTLER